MYLMVSLLWKCILCDVSLVFLLFFFCFSHACGISLFMFDVNTNRNAFLGTSGIVG